MVFLSSDSGTSYPLKHPRLRYGNDLKGYRKQFGFLDYAYSNDNLVFSRDGTAPLSRKEIDGIAIREEFILYPYVHNEIYWSVHKEALAKIQAGIEHPHAAKLKEFQALEQACIWLRECRRMTLTTVWMLLRKMRQQKI